MIFILLKKIKNIFKDKILYFLIFLYFVTKSNNRDWSLKNKANGKN